jgi:hypothetical protein
MGRRGFKPEVPPDKYNIQGQQHPDIQGLLLGRLALLGGRKGALPPGGL